MIFTWLICHLNGFENYKTFKVCIYTNLKFSLLWETLVFKTCNGFQSFCSLLICFRWHRYYFLFCWSKPSGSRVQGWNTNKKSWNGHGKLVRRRFEWQSFSSLYSLYAGCTWLKWVDSIIQNKLKLLLSFLFQYFCLLLYFNISFQSLVGLSQTLYPVYVHNVVLTSIQRS